MKMKIIGIFVCILLIVTTLLPGLHALKVEQFKNMDITPYFTNRFIWSDDFDDGDLSDWTIENPEEFGDLPITLEVTNSQYHSPQYSMLWNGPTSGHPDYSARAWGPEVPINLNKSYSVEFWFRYNHLHWVHLVRFGHLDVIIDYPGLEILFKDDLGNHWVFEQSFQDYCPRNTWTHFKFEVNPIASSIEMIVDGNTIGTFEYTKANPNETKFFIRDPGAGANDYFNLSYYDDIVVDQNYPPNAPSISGETDGKAGKSYDYTFISTDPEEEDIYYFIYWGDDNSSGWIGPYDSGKVIIVSHTWKEKDTYNISARAKDIHGHESNWSRLEVTMPKNKSFIFNYPLLNWLFELFSNAFTIIRYLARLR